MGEGDVGKTCLSNALRAEPGTWHEVFDKDSKTTPGIKIDIGSLQLPNPKPEIDETISLNIWDFGGQEVYYITHQFFFSPRALYCLVWRPRKGPSAGNVEEWMQRIERRVPNARVLVISTCCDELGNPELDEGDLKSKFGDMIAGFYPVDNESGSGIPALLEAIGKEAAELDHMGKPFNPRWKAVRDAALAVANDCPELTRDAFDKLAKKHKLSEDETDVLLDLLHDLGRVVYYRHDEGLRDRVVINPEWLTQAIGYVLNDEKISDNNGELEHSRLDGIWRTHGNEKKDWQVYERKYHPFFLRLMEKFDISYPLPDRPQGSPASLVAQSVPFNAPALPWVLDTPLDDGDKELSLVCEMDHRPDGLMAWMTVRNHRFSRENARLHWRYGVFFSDLGQEALVLFPIRSTELTIHVRGNSPRHLFTLLRDSLVWLIKDRWSELEYKLQIPCRGNRDGKPCAARFPLRNLERLLGANRPEHFCMECLSDQNVAELVAGFQPPLAAPVSPKQDIPGSAEWVRLFNKERNAENREFPSLFTLRRPLSGDGATSTEYELTLWCEHPGHERPVKTYPLTLDTKLAAQMKGLLPLLSKASSVIAQVVETSKLAGVKGKRELNGMRSLLDELGGGPRDLLQDPKRADGADLRGLGVLLDKVDSLHNWGGLKRHFTSAGDYLWISKKFDNVYDPGLPVIYGKKSARKLT